MFVLGLLLIVHDRWMLLKTITAFTVAHSLTLAVATLGYASAPLLPLNAAIALSILFLGPEIVRAGRGDTSLTLRHPWVVAFAFGILNGGSVPDMDVSDCKLLEILDIYMLKSRSTTLPSAGMCTFWGSCSSGEELDLRSLNVVHRPSNLEHALGFEVGEHRAATANVCHG